MSYKIKDLWLSYNLQEKARKYQFYNDALLQCIYINIPSEFTVLLGDYANGLTPEKIRWAKFQYDIPPTTITLFGKDNKLIIGSQGN